MATKSIFLQLSPDELLEIVEIGAKNAIEKHAKEHSIEHFLTREQAAQILNVSPQTVSIYVKKGFVINHGQVAGKHLYRKDELLSAQVNINKSNWKR